MATREPTSLPPSYSGPLLPEPGTDGSLYSELPPDDLPTYTRQPTPPVRVQATQGPKEAISHLCKKGKPWATLTMLANPRLSNSIPTIIEGSNVEGSVKLTLDSSDAIQAIVVSIKGQIITGAGATEQFTFLNIDESLWSQTMGDPRDPSTGPRDVKYDGKLLGDYLWPFSITLPKEVVLPVGPKRSLEVFRLPQTIVERHTRASVQYSLTLRLIRNKLRTDNRIQITFGYIPVIKPGPASLLRQLAYQENTPLFGPDADRDGWHVAESVRVRGTVFGVRSVDAKCTLSLATPLCYTRGSVIPCSMIVETEDLQALDLLSSPKAIVVRLRRCVKCGKGGLDWDNSINYSQLAAWWSSEGATNMHSSRRQIDGELHLPADMKPTSAMAHFRIDYSVVLFPFDAIAYESESKEPLCSIPIEIATFHASGPRPRTYTPPGYEAHHASVFDESAPLRTLDSWF